MVHEKSCLSQCGQAMALLRFSWPISAHCGGDSSWWAVSPRSGRIDPQKVELGMCSFHHERMEASADDRCVLCREIRLWNDLARSAPGLRTTQSLWRAALSPSCNSALGIGSWNGAAPFPMHVEMVLPSRSMTQWRLGQRCGFGRQRREIAACVARPDCCVFMGSFDCGSKMLR